MGNVLISVSKDERARLFEIAKLFQELGFKIIATEGTRKYLQEKNIEAEYIKKMHEGRPNIEDAIKNKEIQLIINTPSGKFSKFDDSYIRKAAIKHKIPYITTLPAALASAKGIAVYQKEGNVVKALQEYHKDI